ncbi:MAG: HD-GYP domain-containing protein [Armatimonadetes bacterium]|nr:HD-GYP domain-containing protein [Armatimonadota bacterium]
MTGPPKVPERPPEDPHPGDSPACRATALVIIAASALLVARELLALLPQTGALPIPGLPVSPAWAASAGLIGLGELFPVPLGPGIHVNLGVAGAFATLLIFPPSQVLPLVTAGVLIAQTINLARGARVRPGAVLFSLAQYLATWSAAAAAYRALQAEGLFAHAGLSWIPVAAAGVTAFVATTLAIATLEIARTRNYTPTLWVGRLRETWPGYTASLALGTAAAGLAVTRPVLVLTLVLSVGLLRRVFLRMAPYDLRQRSAPFEHLVHIIERESPYIAGHSERVADWSRRLARTLELGEDEVVVVEIAGRLHDLGMAALEPDIEGKAGPLTEEEWALVRQHPAIGGETIAALPGLERVARCVWHHHERFDGKGYPDGLQGLTIPPGARIIAVADAFDAMISARPYRAAMPREEALVQIGLNAGTQFDPRVAAALAGLVRTETGVMPAAPRGDLLWEK